MSASTKFSNSVKALCCLAESHPVPQSSKCISESTGLNASKLRKLLSYLSKDGIVESIQGASGGFLLNKNPDQINMQEIYCSIEDRKAFHLDVTKTEGMDRDTGSRLNDYFLNLFSEIQVDIEEKMKKIRLSDIIKSII